MPDERYKGAFEASMEDVQKAETALVQAKKDANVMAAKYGVDAPFKDVDGPTASFGLVLKADQFTNYASPSEAARGFLSLRGQEKGAATLDAIYDALQRGGFTFSSIKNDPKGGLRIALGKDSQVHRLPNGTYGLLEWYPAVKREKEKRRAAKTTGNGGAEDDEDVELTPATPDASEKEGTPA